MRGSIILRRHRGFFAKCHGNALSRDPFHERALQAPCGASSWSRNLSTFNKRPQPAAPNNLRSDITPLSNPSSPRRHEPVDVKAVADKLGVRLTSCERDLLKKKLDFNKDGRVTCSSFTVASQRALEERTMREICLQVIEQPTSAAASFGTRFVSLMDYVGLALFSVVGTQVAGDAGFNLIGSALVGCIAGLGGRTINNVMYGASSPLLNQLPGVFWARNPSYLAIALGSSVLTFFAWPVYCEKMSVHYLETIIGKENLEEDGSVGKDAFVEACHRNEEFLENIRIGMMPKFEMSMLRKMSASELFHHIDLDGSGTIDAQELKLLVQEHIRNSGEIYAIDSVALSAYAVAGVHGAIRMGLHPLVAATSGITMSLGGVLRDVFCGRDIAVASQSYALATGAGSAVYVVTRELALRGFPIWAAFRILLSMGTTISIRYWEYAKGEPLLGPMHGRKTPFDE